MLPGMAAKLPATDVRLRPDMRLLEEGYAAKVYTTPHMTKPVSPIHGNTKSFQDTFCTLARLVWALASSPGLGNASMERVHVSLMPVLHCMP